MSSFKNEPLTNFSERENRNKMLSALEKVQGELGRSYPLWIGGEEVKTKETFSSYNPSKPSEVIGVFQKGTHIEAERAIACATRAFETWRYTPPQARANILFEAAKRMKSRKYEFAAWMVYEVGKNWAEADGDVAEAIDFLNFYGEEVLRYGKEQPVTQIPSEKNTLFYIPLGVGVVIPPWNFPLAILVGMTSAAFGSGNTVVLKPSSDAPAIGTQFVELLKEIGLPPGVVNLVTGGGSTVGDTLVQHPKTRFISFTGSMEVGLDIYKKAAQAQEGQIWLKRVVAEMGGKDAIVVDKDANIEEAVQAIVSSAFGFQGQKCSARSRAIIHRDRYEEVAQKVVDLTLKIEKDLEKGIGPIINQSAEEKILSYIEIGKEEGKLLCGGGKMEGEGYFIKPTLFKAF